MYACRFSVCVFCFLSRGYENKAAQAQSHAAVYASDVHPLSLRVCICMLRNIWMAVGQRCGVGPAPSDAAFAEYGGTQ